MRRKLYTPRYTNTHNYLLYFTCNVFCHCGHFLLIVIDISDLTQYPIHHSWYLQFNVSQLFRYSKSEFKYQLIFYTKFSAKCYGRLCSVNCLYLRKDILIQFCIGCLLTRNHVVKVINCVILRFRNTEMYSAIYVASYYKKYFWMNVLYKMYSLNLHTHTVFNKLVYEFK